MKKEVSIGTYNSRFTTFLIIDTLLFDFGLFNVNFIFLHFDSILKRKKNKPQINKPLGVKEKLANYLLLLCSLLQFREF